MHLFNSQELPAFLLGFEALELGVKPRPFVTQHMACCFLQISVSNNRTIDLVVRHILNPILMEIHNSVEIFTRVAGFRVGSRRGDDQLRRWIVGFTQELGPVELQPLLVLLGVGVVRRIHGQNVGMGASLGLRISGSSIELQHQRSSFSPIEGDSSGCFSKVTTRSSVLNHNANLARFVIQNTKMNFITSHILFCNLILFFIISLLI